MIDPTDEDIGRHVIYARPYCKEEAGTITSFTEKVVFVRYGLGSTSQATEREDLNWAYGAKP
jgi:hypothetical protein